MPSACEVIPSQREDVVPVEARVGHLHPDPPFGDLRFGSVAQDQSGHWIVLVRLLAAGPCQRRTSSPAAALLVQASRRAGDDDARHSLQQNAIASVECRVVAKKDAARLVESASADANPGFGTLVSESGSASTWSENAHEFRLTPWSNDPVSDPNTEAFYIRGFGLQRGRHVIHRPSAHAGERRHDDAIGQIH